MSDLSPASDWGLPYLSLSWLQQNGGNSSSKAVEESVPRRGLQGLRESKGLLVKLLWAMNIFMCSPLHTFGQLLHIFQRENPFQH